MVVATAMQHAQLLATTDHQIAHAGRDIKEMARTAITSTNAKCPHTTARPMLHAKIHRVRSHVPATAGIWEMGHNVTTSTNVLQPTTAVQPMLPVMIHPDRSSVHVTLASLEMEPIALISTSVMMQLPTIVMTTPTVPILSDRSHVHATQVIQGTAHSVKTYMNAINLLMTVLPTRPALIRMDLSYAHVWMDTLEMELYA